MTVGILLRKKNWILHPRYGAFTGKWLCKISDLKVIFSEIERSCFSSHFILYSPKKESFPNLSCAMSFS